MGPAFASPKTNFARAEESQNSKNRARRAFRKARELSSAARIVERDTHEF
jgi:hypothetical protein